MKNPRTAPVLLALLFTLIISLCAGLPQAAQAAEPMTIEGTWMITGGPQTGIITNVLQQGQKITIRRQGPREYEVLYSDGKAVRYYGSATEIKFTRTAKFEELKRGIPKAPDTALGEAAAAGVQRTDSYKLSPDGRSMLKTIDQVVLYWDIQSGHLSGKKIEIKPASQPSAILTRVPETTAPTKTAERKPSEETPPGPATEETETPEQPAKPRKSVAKQRPAQPKGGSLPPPELPAGGALSGN